VKSSESGSYSTRCYASGQSLLSSGDRLSLTINLSHWCSVSTLLKIALNFFLSPVASLF